MASCAYGIDLGTNNIKIYSKGSDEIFTAKNIIAIERKDILFAYGDPAFDMYEKAVFSLRESFVSFVFERVISDKTKFSGAVSVDASVFSVASAVSVFPFSLLQPDSIRAENRREVKIIFTFFILIFSFIAFN